jgi:hypothetical protein
MARASDLLTTSMEMFLRDGVPLPEPLPADACPIVISDLG